MQCKHVSFYFGVPDSQSSQVGGGGEIKPIRTKFHVLAKNILIFPLNGTATPFCSFSTAGSKDPSMFMSNARVTFQNWEFNEADGSVRHLASK